MPMQMTHATPSEVSSLPLNAVRWPAVFAGLVVGIATNLFLMLLGAAAGLAVFAASDTAPDTGIPIAAAIWNALSMIVAAFAGGYVAARTANMRRASDGILHGVVAWGVTMLISAFVVTSATGATLASLFNFGGNAVATSAANGSAAADVAGSLRSGDREEAISVMQDRLGLSADQASRLVDQALALSGREGAASPAGRAAAQETLRTASVASGWLSAAILLSLLSAIGGGLMGARGTRREVRRGVPGTATPVL
jgi:hypothetical protein